MVTELDIVERIKTGSLSGDYVGDQVVGQVFAGNGYAVTIDPNTGRLWDTMGRYGYQTHFGNLFVCYSCGHLCECFDTEE